MLTVAEAQARLLEGVTPLPAVATPLAEAAGLVLGEAVLATRDLPAFDNSAMDGFAVRVDDLRDASAEAPARLRVIGEAAAGRAFAGEVAAGTAVRIMTGAPLPAGA